MKSHDLTWRKSGLKLWWFRSLILLYLKAASGKSTSEGFHSMFFFAYTLKFGNPKRDVFSCLAWMIQMLLEVNASNSRYVKHRLPKWWPVYKVDPLLPSVSGTCMWGELDHLCTIRSLVSLREEWLVSSLGLLHPAVCKNMISLFNRVW